MIGLLLALSLAFAGEPAAVPIPVEYIPWDSLWVDTKLQFDTTDARVGYWYLYISRDAYEVRVLGKKKELIELDKSLDALNQLLQQAEQKKSIGDQEWR